MPSRTERICESQPHPNLAAPIESYSWWPQMKHFQLQERQRTWATGIVKVLLALICSVPLYSLVRRYKQHQTTKLIRQASKQATKCFASSVTSPNSGAATLLKKLAHVETTRKRFHACPLYKVLFQGMSEPMMKHQSLSRMGDLTIAQSQRAWNNTSCKRICFLFGMHSFVQPYYKQTQGEDFAPYFWV